jgi:hypothetical protein
MGQEFQKLLRVDGTRDDTPISRPASPECSAAATADTSPAPSVPWTRSADYYGVGALTFYFILSVLFFGRALAGHLSDYHVGVDIPADSTIFIWSLAWWRHALLHHLNPLLTTAIWAPGGINLAWVPHAPLAALIAIPATSAFGPVATCNVLFILSPALSAWPAFLLCRRISNSYSSALVGGYIFGFSAYMLGQMQGHLHQLLAFPVPLAVYLVVRQYQGNIRTRDFIISIAFTLAAEFLIALEVFATMTIFGLLAIALALAVSPNDLRKRIASAVLPLSLGCALATVIVSPFIYYLFAPGNPHWGSMYSADPIGFLIPTTYFELGRLSFFKAIASRFPFDAFESDTYFGPVLIAIAALYARRHWREPFARMMIDALIIVAVFTLGPILHVMGRNLAGMPGAIIASLPLMTKATPARFAMYAFLILAVISSIWLSELSCAPTVKVAIVGLIVLSTLPNLSAAYWVRPTNTPAFFTTGTYRKYLSPGETVIALPYWMLGNCMIWQAQTEMYFRMAGAWTGPPPPEFDRWPIVKALATNMLPPEPELQFKAFVANHSVDAVIAGSGTDPVFQPMLSSLDNTPIATGGVTIYRTRRDALAPYRQLTALAMETRADRERFDTLVAAANRYLVTGHELAALSPSVANHLGLIPPGWVHYDKVLAFNALWIGPWKDDGVSIGITGSYTALKPLIQRYRGDASRIYFPFPAELQDHPIVPEGSYVIMIMFDHAGLARAAAKAVATPAFIDAPRSTR